MSKSSLAILYLLFVTQAPYARAHDDRPEPLVTVTGIGEVRVAPDEVVLTIGDRTLDQDVAKSSQENDARVKKVFELARLHGLAEKDIHTDYVSIYAEYEQFQDRERKFLGYATRQVIALTLRDVAKHQALVTELLKSGVDEIRGIEWRSSRVTEHRAEARRMAVHAARDKARALAQALGQDIGRAHTITEEQPSDYASSHLSNDTMDIPSGWSHDDAPARARPIQHHRTSHSCH